MHPLGKSPVITVQGPEGPPVVIAETGAIVEYLIDHFGPQLIPTRYPAGKEGQPGAETEEWLRYRHFMHYAEGSIMPFLVFTLVIERRFYSQTICLTPANTIRNQRTNGALDRPTNLKSDRQWNRSSLSDAKLDYPL